MVKVNKKGKSQLEKVAIIAMYCHLRPPDAIALNVLWGFASELQTNPMPFHLSLWGATLMPIIGVRWTGKEQNSEGG